MILRSGCGGSWSPTDSQSLSSLSVGPRSSAAVRPSNLSVGHISVSFSSSVVSVCHPLAHTALPRLAPGGGPPGISSLPSLHPLYRFAIRWPIAFLSRIRCLELSCYFHWLTGTDRFPAGFADGHDLCPRRSLLCSWIVVIADETPQGMTACCQGLHRSRAAGNSMAPFALGQARPRRRMDLESAACQHSGSADLLAAQALALRAGRLPCRKS